jgi:peptidoglycan/LPS O-acetylase OafA/YrhL
MGYIKQIDFLRAIAIFCVVITHWSSADSVFYYISTTVSGPFIFFTISGFLITKILITERTKAEVSGSSNSFIFKNFFIRRALRIFPAYYLTIFIVYFLNNDPISSYYSYLTFTTNFYQNHTQQWGLLPHLWSMAVEEQFYLFWPAIILLIPKKLLLPNILLFIFIGIISRFIFPYNDFSLTLPYTCFDALGLGALLSWILVFRVDLIPKVFKLLTLMAVVSVVLIIIGKLGILYTDVFHRTFISIITTWALLLFIINRENLTNRYTEKVDKVLGLIGKISYGIFLYHIPIIEHSHKVLTPLNTFLLLPDVIKHSRSFFLLENLIILLVLSLVSWKFFELPISKLKKYFKDPKLKVVLVDISKKDLY